jgi:preprotein translocase subunit YajC
MNGLFFILILLGAAWVLLMIPARRRRGQHEAMQDSVEAGDEIITAGGIHGTVKEIEDGTARVEIAPGVVVTLDRRAVAAVATELEVEPGEGEREDPGPGTDVEPR